MDSDETLRERIRRGDLVAFDALFERHEARLFAYLRAVLRDRRDAEEVLHDAFLSVLRDDAAVFDRPGAFQAWLYRVARNMALNRKRSSGRHDRALSSFGAEPDDGPRMRAAPPPPDRALEARQLEEALTAAVDRLPSALAELWSLRTSGLSYEQIASVTDVPLGTVKSRMHQMVSVLRKELSPWIAPE